MPLLERTQPKAPGSYDRSKPVAETLAAETAIRATYGITRVGELTHLDRIGIPVYCAIVPDSADSITVYNGKGVTRDAARAGAIMEAAERQAASRVRGRVSGSDLFDGRPVAATFDDVRTSNGFAAGNTWTEAVYHALCEVVERHVLSVAHAIAHERPRAIVARFAGHGFDDTGFIDDRIARDFTLPTGSAAVDALLAAIAAAGLPVRLRAVELPPLPILFIATIVAADASVSRSHTGYGCSLSPEHAAVRAITEAAQGRLGDIQAAREDLTAADAVTGDPRHRRETALPHGRWYFDGPAQTARFDRLPDRSTGDLACDVDRLVSVLQRAGCSHASIFDVSPPDLPIAVVRAVAGGLESTMVDGIIGTTIATILDVTSDPRASGGFALQP